MSKLCIRSRQGGERLRVLLSLMLFAALENRKHVWCQGKESIFYAELREAVVRLDMAYRENISYIGNVRYLPLADLLLLSYHRLSVVDGPFPFG